MTGTSMDEATHPEFAGEGLQFKVLGPVQVWRGGRQIPIKGGHDRHLLGRLILGADRPIPRDVLIDALWHTPPDSALRVLENTISRLRRDLDDAHHQLIRFVAQGYELSLDTATSDYQRFRTASHDAVSAAQSGSHREALNAAEQALALWRGPALADVSGELVGALRLRLDHERSDIARVAAESAVAVGEFDNALDRLEALVESEPLDDRLRVLQMSAQSGAGRRSEALATFRHVRRLHRERDGLDPSPELAELHERLLRGEEPRSASPALSLPLPRQLPARLVNHVGRHELIEQVRASLDPDRRQTQIFVLTGPGGVGKTTSAIAVAHLLAEEFPDGQLYAELRGMRDEPVAPHQTLGRFIRALGFAPADVPEDVDERTAVFRSLTAGRRILVVLDDAASEEQVVPLLPDGAVAIVTSRHRLPLLHAHRWVLAPLEPTASAELLAQGVGTQRLRAEPEAVTAITELCGDLPLALAVVSGRLAAHPEWSLSEFAHSLGAERARLDQLQVSDWGVRASIALSYRSLTDDARTAFRRLGIQETDDWPSWIGPVLADLDPDRTRRALDELTDVHLVESLGRDSLGQSRYRMHDLVTSFARERFLEVEDAAAREQTYGRYFRAWLGVVAAADSAMDHGQGIDKIPEWIPAGSPATAEENPRRWFENEHHGLLDLFDLCIRHGDPEYSGLLALGLWGHLDFAHEDAVSEAMLVRAQAATDAPGYEVLHLRIVAARIAALYRLGQYDAAGPLVHRQLEVAERLGNHDRVTRALSQLSLWHVAMGRLDQALALARHGVDSYSHGAKVTTRSLLHSQLGLVLLHAGRPDEALPQLEISNELLRGNHEYRRVHAWRLTPFVDACIDAGMLDSARKAIEEGLEILQDYDDEASIRYLEIRSADIALREGDLQTARSLISASLAAWEEFGDIEEQGVIQRQYGDLELLDGNAQAARHRLSRSVQLARSTSRALDVARALARLAVAESAAGDPDAAALARRECDDILTARDLDSRALRLPSYFTDRLAGG